MSATRKTAEQMDAVLRELDSFCHGDCQNTWACKGCPIDGAKKKMVWLTVGTRIEVLNESLTPEMIRDIDCPSRHFTLIPGGKRGQ